MKVLRCRKCGRVVKVLRDSGAAGVVCCGEEMEVLVPNSVDAAAEKHVPEVSREGDLVTVRVNHVMEPEHFIEWVGYEVGENVYFKRFVPGEEAVAVFRVGDSEEGTAYAFCNLHGLWEGE